MTDSKDDIESISVGGDVDMEPPKKCGNTIDVPQSEGNLVVKQPAVDLLNFVQSKNHEFVAPHESKIESDSVSIMNKTPISLITFPKNSGDVHKLSSDYNSRSPSANGDAFNEVEQVNVETFEKSKTFDGTDVMSDMGEVTDFSKDNQDALSPVTKKITNLPDGYTDSSHSSSPELSTDLLKSSEISLEKNAASSKTDFENVILKTADEKESCELTGGNVPDLHKKLQSSPTVTHLPQASENMSYNDFDEKFENCNSKILPVSLNASVTETSAKCTQDKDSYYEPKEILEEVEEPQISLDQSKPVIKILPQTVEECVCPQSRILESAQFDSTNAVIDETNSLLKCCLSHPNESMEQALPETLPNLLIRSPECSEQDSLTLNLSEQTAQETLPAPTVEILPLPLPAPTPRKRGRPRKQVLPPPTPTGDSVLQITTPATIPNDSKRSTRSERRQAKKKKIEEEVKKPPREKRSKQNLKAPVQRKKTKKTTYVPKKRGPPPKKKHSEVENIQNFEEETRMSASEGPGGFSSKSGKKNVAVVNNTTGIIYDESQSSFMTDGHTKSNANKKGRMEVVTDGCKPVTVQQIVEYHWPPPSSHGEKSEGLMIQEQITEYLGVKSFKRKYPSIKRRPVDMEERNYLQENGFVSENMCDMGLTAVFSADIIEIMYNDFPQKFEEYRKYTREKKAKEQRALREKQAAERADMDPQKEAVESAQNWNAEFNKIRREKRASCFDLQTFTVHFPANRYKRVSLGKPGHYPIALIPGQNTEYYKKYTSNELKYFPINTVIYGPLRPNERHFALPGGSDGSQSEIDDSSSSDESSSSSSEETQDTEETNSTADEEVPVEVKVEKEVEEKEPRTPKSSQKTPKGRGRGKVVVPATINSEPKKRLGRPPKLKLAAIKLKRIDREEISQLIKDEKPDTATRVIIHTCKMCHEEESKNKNLEFEAFIQCSQCKGKIHPSCIDLTAEMIPKISSYGWQCTDCKSCVKCEQSTNEDKMIFCDQCDRGYHIYCVGLSEVPSGNYICHVCKPGEEMDTSNNQKESEESQVKDELTELKVEIKTEQESMDITTSS